MFSSLKVNVVNFRATDSNLFSIDRYPNDASIEVLGYANGIERLKFDCFTIFKVNTTTDLDPIVTLYEEYFKRALMFIQLHYFYQSRAGEFGELNNERAKFYLKEYLEYIKKFYEFDVNGKKPNRVKSYEF